MPILEISKSDITSLNDSDLRELLGRLCEAELKSQAMPISGVFWGGSQTSADSGLDAEVILIKQQPNSDFIPKKHTGFQVKKNSMAAQACFDEMHLKGKLRPIIQKLIDEEGAYIIVSGKDDCTRKMLDDRTEKMESAISDLKNYKSLKIDFYGVDRLATWVRKHPSIVLWIRRRLGKPLSGWKGFERWAATPSSVEDNYLVDEKLLVMDSTISSDNKSSILESINKIRLLLLTPQTAVRITGLSGVGKTRFAQALFEDDVGEDSLNPSQVIYADLGENIEPSSTDMLSQLIAQNERMILVLDNCPPDVHRSLQKKLKEVKSQLSLLTIEYDISDDKPEETKVFHLEPASEEIVEKILIIRFPELGQLNSRTISNFSGGNSRLAIALAERVEAGESLSGFSDEELFQRLFSQRKDKDNNLLESAEALSLVYSFNIDTTVKNPELDVLAEVSGKTINELYRASSSLLNRKLIQKRADWRALLPHALANRIAKQALSNIPVNQILSVLSRPENNRLLKSFSRRLSYLHDCEEAKKIAQEWLSDEGILGDLQNIDSDGIDILYNIAPVNPSATLNRLKVNANNNGITTRKNKNSSNLVVLLRKLAYDEYLFNDAVDILVSFAKTEKDNNKDANKVISELFRITLSGTQATPEARSTYIRELFSEGDGSEKRIALELLNAALQASHFVSHHNFEFGAHPRGIGYRPSTYTEQKKWYQLFVALALEILVSSNVDAESLHKTKTILGRQFRGLWNVGMYDELESIAHEITKTGYWFEGWKGVVDTIHFGENISSDLINRLKKLRGILEPKDIQSKIEALVFHDIYENLQFNEDTYEDDEVALQEEVRNLGVFTSNDSTLLDKISMRLFTESTSSLYFFGQGLAKGARNKKDLFSYLLGIVSEINIDQIDVRLLGGFIQRINNDNSELADELLGVVLLNPKLRRYFLYIQCHIPINKNGYERILDLASGKTIPTWNFQPLASGRCHESLTDDELASVIELLNKNKAGYQVSLHILNMRFWRKKECSFSSKLLQVSRDTLQEFFSSYKESEYNNTKDSEISNVGKVCLADSAPPEQINSVLQGLILAIIKNNIYSFHMPQTLKMICEEHTSLVLDIVYDSEDREHALYQIFKENIGRGLPLDLVESDELINWCKNGAGDRFTFVAKAIFPFVSLSKDTDASESNSIELSKNALAILEASQNKEEIVNVFYQSCSPSSWSGSRYLIVQSRREALEVLHEHSDESVVTLSKKLARDISEQEEKERINEMALDSQREQRFE